MFTFDDIRAIAVQIENNGESAYRRAAARVDDPRLAELFRWMAEEEQRHGRYFAGIKGARLAEAGAEAAQRMGRELLQEMVKDQTFSLDGDDLAARSISPRPCGSRWPLRRIPSSSISFSVISSMMRSSRSNWPRSSPRSAVM